MKPLLLLDIDGVLAPLGRSLPSGFVRYETDEFSVAINPGHANILRSLAEKFELTWASTWEEKANPVFGSLFALPSMPFIRFEHLKRDGTRKLDDVQRYVGDRPFAWVDDELYEDANEWCRSRRSPALLVRTSPYVGLLPAHVQDLLNFADSIEWT